MGHMFVEVETIGQLEKDLKQAREDLLYAESQQQAGQSVLTRSREDNNELKAKNKQHAQEIERLKAQLAAAEEKNQQTSRALAGKHALPLDLMFLWYFVFDDN